MKKNDFLVEQILIKSPGVINHSMKPQFEVKPGVFLPVFINIKMTLVEFKTRRKIAKLLSEKVSKKTDYVCGVESGGSYYGVAVSDLLGKPIIFLRKTKKDYGDKRRIVGSDFAPGSKVAVVDDVIATGSTILDAIKYFKKLNCKIEAFSVFSYKTNKQLAKNLKTPASSLANFDNLFLLIKRYKIWEEKEIKYVEDFVKNYG